MKIERRGMMFVMSSPSGAGKTTISRLLLERDKNLAMSVSVTTRKKRPSEVEGRDYYFISTEEFSRMTLQKELLEHAQVFDNYYGTPKKTVEKALSEGRDVLFDIDWQGTRQLKRNNRLDLVSTFILPPSLTELARRLRQRAQDDEEVVKKRMAKAVEEISHWNEYDYVLVNSDVEETLEKVLAVLNAERCRRDRQTGMLAFVERLAQEA